jgi:hypothetical protein
MDLMLKTNFTAIIMFEDSILQFKEPVGDRQRGEWGSIVLPAFCLCGRGENTRTCTIGAKAASMLKCYWLKVT